MAKKRMVLSDGSVNRYGYRVLTEGINLEIFKKNPIMLYMHIRDDDWKQYGEKAIGHWEDLEIEDGVLYGVPVFDGVDELSKTIEAKFNAGTYRAASIGFHVISTSSEPEHLLPGQTRETVTSCDLLEASIVDIPANHNAVRLYNDESLNTLAFGDSKSVVPALKNQTAMKKSFKAILALLGLSADQAESTNLTVDQMESLDASIDGLQQQVRELTALRDSLNTQVEEHKATITSLTSEKETLSASVETKDAEIAALTQEKAELAAQVENLKSKESPSDNLSPQGEKGEEVDSLAAFSSEEHSVSETIEFLKKENLI